MKLPVSLIILVALATAAAAEDVKTVAKASYDAVDRAFVARDIKAVDAAMRSRTTSDFKAISGGRQVDYKGLLANFRGMFTTFTSITNSTSKIVSCKVSGNSAAIRVFGTLSAKVKARDGKTHQIDLTNTSDDVWKQVGGKWKCASSTTIKESTAVDGKLAPPRKPVNV